MVAVPGFASFTAADFNATTRALEAESRRRSRAMAVNAKQLNDALLLGFSTLNQNARELDRLKFGAAQAGLQIKTGPGGRLQFTPGKLLQLERQSKTATLLAGQEANTIEAEIGELQQVSQAMEDLDREAGLPEGESLQPFEEQQIEREIRDLRARAGPGARRISEKRAFDKEARTTELERLKQEVKKRSLELDEDVLAEDRTFTKESRKLALEGSRVQIAKTKAGIKKRDLSGIGIQLTPDQRVDLGVGTDDEEAAWLSDYLVFLENNPDIVRASSTGFKKFIRNEKIRDAALDESLRGVSGSRIAVARAAEVVKNDTAKDIALRLMRSATESATDGQITDIGKLVEENRTVPLRRAVFRALDLLVNNEILGLNKEAAAVLLQSQLIGPLERELKRVARIIKRADGSIDIVPIEFKGVVGGAQLDVAEAKNFEAIIAVLGIDLEELVTDVE